MTLVDFSGAFEVEDGTGTRFSEIHTGDAMLAWRQDRTENILPTSLPAEDTLWVQDLFSVVGRITEGAFPYTRLTAGEWWINANHQFGGTDGGGSPDVHATGVPGQPFTVAIMARSNLAMPFRVALNVRNAAGGQVANMMGPITTPPANTWATIRHTATPAAGGVFLGARLMTGAGVSITPGNTQIDFGMMLITPGTYDGSVFTGSSPNWGNEIHSWTGTPGHSPSTRLRAFRG